MNEIPYRISDGGFSGSGIVDKNNCTVVGFANATGINYKIADEIAVKTGRKRKKGHWPDKMVTYAKRVHSLKFKKLKFKQMTVQKFIKKYPTGKYIVSRSRHCFAIVDGYVLDRANFNTPMQRITEAWKFER